MPFPDYGKFNQLKKEQTTTPKPAEITSSRTIEGKIGGGEVKPIDTSPPFGSWMAQAREANPGVSDEDLKKYYEGKYGTK